MVRYGCPKIKFNHPKIIPKNRVFVYYKSKVFSINKGLEMFVMRIKAVFLSVLATAFLFGLCLPCAAATPKLYEKLGGNNIDILKDAKYVTMLIMSPDPKKGPLEEIHLTSEQIERLKTNLLNDHNYDFAKPKHCHFIPQLSFKLQTEAETLHLFISLNCNQILFGTGNQTVLLTYNPVQQRLGHFFDELISEAYIKNKKSRLSS